MTNTQQKKKTILIIAVVAAVINGLLIFQLLHTTNKQSTQTIDYKLTHPISTPHPRLATFSLSPSNTTVSPDAAVTLTLNLKTDFKLSGADAILRFNPEMLTVEKVNAGEMFSLYPRVTYDNNTGRVIITGINLKSDALYVMGTIALNQPFATITLRPKQTGQTQVQFDFEYGQTTSSTAVKADDAKNILSYVENATINIVEQRYEN